MKDKYIIIDKTLIQKRIEELEKQKKNLEVDDFDGFNLINAEINGLKFYLGQSTPLIPEIVKAFDAGVNFKWKGLLIKKIEIEEELKDYLSNLKLDI